MILTKPTISLIIPVYNTGDYLARCLDSILSQAYGNMDAEIILVDDGSKDKSGIICDDYAERYDNVRVFHIENSGVSIARNYGFEKSTGQWVWFIDSDDWIRDGALKVIAEILENNGTDAIFWNFFEVNDISSAAAIGNCTLKKFMTNDFVINYTPWQMWQLLFRRDILINHNIRFKEKVKIGEDVEFLIKYLTKCNEVVAIDQALYYYFIRQTSAVRTNTDSNENAWNLIRLISRLIDYVEEETCPIQKWIRLYVEKFYVQFMVLASRSKTFDKTQLRTERKRIEKFVLKYPFSGRGRILSLLSMLTFNGSLCLVKMLY